MATDKNNETYNEEFSNTVRIIKILIDIGTTVLRECFPIFINKAANDKANLFSNKQFKDKTELFQEILNDPNEKLSKEQSEKLKKGDIAKFDITLFFLVYKHFLKQHSKELKYIKKIKDLVEVLPKILGLICSTFFYSKSNKTSKKPHVLCRPKYFLYDYFYFHLQYRISS
jgi:hypothetical protein